MRPAPELTGTPHGVRLERLVTGAGAPVTLFVPGLAGDIAGTRPLGSAVAGTRVFVQLRGHGRSSAPPGPWSFADLARDVRAAADAAGATRAVAVSLGAAALCRLLAGAPDRFDRVVLYLPAPVDGDRPAAARDRFARLTQALARGDAAAVAAAVAAEIPAPARDTPDARRYAAGRAARLLTDGLAPQLDTVWSAPALPDAAALRAVTARTLVIGARDDPVHPVATARGLAGLLPGAEYHELDAPGGLWTHRAALRALISGFLGR